MLGLVVLHLAAVLVTSILARENLVKAMWTGRKQSAQPGEGIARPWRALGRAAGRGAGLLGLELSQAPPGGAAIAARPVGRRQQRHHRAG